ncbi:hypothetical protein CEXT_150081 [Caerostris extrusa]|uniref:Uncharacterized protein n=1 Tax=Caerostris extrusa TaxID=172846 RepID=A0AAV4W7I6_CAEEX|nr:hypothetical protein CEXT_150081 [Caerostris extrusa]
MCVIFSIHHWKKRKAQRRSRALCLATVRELIRYSREHFFTADRFERSLVIVSNSTLDLFVGFEPESPPGGPLSAWPWRQTHTDYSGGGMDLPWFMSRSHQIGAPEMIVEWQTKPNLHTPGKTDIFNHCALPLVLL